MNVFEDLIEELKAEQLIEDSAARSASAANGSPAIKRDIAGDNAHVVSAQELSGNRRPVADEAMRWSLVPEFASPEEEREFFRRRAVDEVSSLQIVEHLFANVERAYLRTVPAVFDDREIKASLQDFMAATDDVGSEEFVNAEFTLLGQIEAWKAALRSRDAKISVSDLRLFCERSKPALSSQAMLSLARFYRNVAFTDVSRSKFEFVMTRLFSRDIGDQKRSLLFGYNEMLGHIRSLYENWSSIDMLSGDDLTNDFLQAKQNIRELVAECERFASIDELLQRRFLDRFKSYKEFLDEMFFAPEVLGEMIDANVRVGNCYVELVEREKESYDPTLIREKYGVENDGLIAAAAGRSLFLADLLDQAEMQEAVSDDEIAENETASVQETRVVTESAVPSFLSLDLAGVNRWLLGTTLLVVVGCVGLFLWSERSSEASGAQAAAPVQLAAAGLGEHLTSGRMTGQTLYAVAKPSFAALDAETQKNVLGKALEIAKQKGLTRVELMNEDGNSIGVANDRKIEVFKRS